jgi:hypothetical protein
LHSSQTKVSKVVGLPQRARTGRPTLGNASKQSRQRRRPPACRTADAALREEEVGER